MIRMLAPPRAPAERTRRPLHDTRNRGGVAGSGPRNPDTFGLTRPARTTILSLAERPAPATAAEADSHRQGRLLKDEVGLTPSPRRLGRPQRRTRMFMHRPLSVAMMAASLLAAASSTRAGTLEALEQARGM